MSRVEEAQEILKALGLPDAQQNRMSALTLLGLVAVGASDPWTKATRSKRTIAKDVMTFIAKHYDKAYASGSRESIRRQALHQFMQARVVDYNAFAPDLPTNSPHAHYAISEAALTAIRTYGTPAWSRAAAQFVAKHGALAAAYTPHRSRGKLVPLTLPGGRTIELSPGKHNLVQKAIVEDFAPRFAAGAELLYIGDTAKKIIVMERAKLAEFGLSVSDHDKLPDVVLLDRKRGWLFLIEAVTSHGPMSPKRVFELAEQVKGKKIGPVYVTAFPDMAQFRRHMQHIAWETEIWIAEIPDHMIHFNGDRFLGPRPK